MSADLQGLTALQVVKLKEARDKLVSNFWTWDSPFDEVEDEMRVRARLDSCA